LRSSAPLTKRPAFGKQSLGKSVSSEWKAAINADIERIGTIVWLGSRAFLHYLTTSVATGKTTVISRATTTASTA
jgi:hypothetical protein